MAHEPRYADEAAFPRPAVKRDDGTSIYHDQWGLTRREYFAGLAMQGLCIRDLPDTFSGDFGGLTAAKIARIAVAHADALLKALTDNPEAK